MSAFGDCLVLQIQEIEEFTGSIDTNLFVMFDKNEEKYLIRGKRMDLTTRVFNTYSFECDDSEAMYNFITFIICRDNNINYTLFNYNDLPLSSDDITYEYLMDNASRTKEIAGYDNINMNRKRLRNLLDMLRGVFNYY
jgi:hypothetical protein